MSIFENLARRIVKRVLGEQYTFIAPLSKQDRRVITETGAIYSVAYLSCELAKMQPVSNLPVCVYSDADGSPRKVPEHPLNTLVSKRWNAYMTAPEGWRWLILRRDTYGNATVRVKWNRLTGEPVALYPVEQTPQLLYDERTGKCWWEVLADEDFCPAGRYQTHEILVFKSPVSTDGGVSGRSLAKLAAENIGLSIDLEQFYHRLLTNGNHFPGWLETDDDLTNEEKEAVAESIRSTSGVVNSGQIRIFDKGLKYKQNPMTMADVNLVDQETWVLQQCCRVCRVPPSMVYENSKATYSNVESMNLQFAQTTLSDEAQCIEDGLQPVLDVMRARFPSCYVKFNLNGYMRGAYRDRMEGYRIGVYAGFFTRAEVREWEELPPIEGLDEPLQPTAYYTVRDGEPYNPSADPLAPVREDMEDRVRRRLSSGDPERGREVARQILRPLADAYEIEGVPYDIESEIERLSR